MMDFKVMRLLFPALAAGLVSLTLLLPASDAAGPPFIGSVAWGKAPFITFGEDSNRPGLYRVYAHHGRPARLTALGSAESGTSVSPDGRTLAFGSGSSLHRISVTGTGLAKLGQGFAPVWSPDGKRIAYVDGSGVWVMKANGAGKHKIVTNRYLEFDPTVAWSPDGSKLAYTRCSAPNGSDPCEHDYGFDVYTIRLDGTHQHRVTPTSGSPQCAAWSSEGTLAFAGDDGLEIVQQDGTLQTYTPGGCPAWAPSGKRLAVGTGSGILVMNADGSGRRSITIVPGSSVLFGQPAWSGDGRWLAITGGGRSQHLWVVRANGTHRRRIF